MAAARVMEKGYLLKRFLAASAEDIFLRGWCRYVGLTLGAVLEVRVD